MPSLLMVLVFLHCFYAYEGEAADAVTPAGLPQEPSPFEDYKLTYAST